MTSSSSLLFMMAAAILLTCTPGNAAAVVGGAWSSGLPNRHLLINLTTTANQCTTIINNACDGIADTVPAGVNTRMSRLRNSCTHTHTTTSTVQACCDFVTSRGSGFGMFSVGAGQCFFYASCTFLNQAIVGGSTVLSALAPPLTASPSPLPLSTSPYAFGVQYIRLRNSGLILSVAGSLQTQSMVSGGTCCME